MTGHQTGDVVSSAALLARPSSVICDRYEHLPLKPLDIAQDWRHLMARKQVGEVIP